MRQRSETTEASGAVEGAIAEVISSTITQLSAECFAIDDQAPDIPPKPRFGSFLKINSEENGLIIYAVVYNVTTGPQDSIHKPSALGMTRQQLQLEQPHIFSLLKTQVHAAVVGHSIAGRMFQHLPPQPPEVHDFVYNAEAEEIMAVCEGFEFLRLLANVTEVPTDELMAATIREAHRAAAAGDEFLVEAGRALSYILRTDYDRLLAILRKIRPRYGSG